MRWGRFLMGGAVNTAFTYAIYLVLNLVLEYQIAYFIAYALGVMFSYCFNALVVFKVKMTWKGFCAYPLVYVIQYALSATGLAVLVDVFGISKEIAPLMIIVMMIPLTYILSKLVIVRKERNDKSI